MGLATTADSVSRLLDVGVRAFARSRQLCEQAAGLQREARELVLTFRMHRFRPMLGSSDVDGPDGLRQRLGAFAAFGVEKTYVGLSRGATCGACSAQIFAGDVEYDVIVARGAEIRLDGACYLILVDEVARLQPEL